MRVYLIGASMCVDVDKKSRGKNEKEEKLDI